jgi:hypothetical protein
MIPSIDTYLQQEIESKLQIILSNRYIIEEILKEIQPSIATNFINTYTGSTPREISIVYSLPQTKESQQGAIYIGLREGAESKPSLGYLEGGYDFKEGDVVKESQTIQATSDLTECYFEMTQPVGSLNNVEGIEFAKSDNVHIDGQQILFKYDPSLVGLTFNVNYIVTEGKEIGLKKGFTAEEHYSVLAVSINMDTVRCLDLIIKAIFILMRDNQQEHRNFLLQKLQFGQIVPINEGTGADSVPEILYGRETIVSYTTSYSLDVALQDAVLNAININAEFE